VVNQFQARVFCFKDDVQEHQGRVRMLFHEFSCFGARIGMEDNKASSHEGEIGKGFFRYRVDGALIIRDQDFPSLSNSGFDGRRRFSFKDDLIALLLDHGMDSLCLQIYDLNVFEGH